MPNPEPIPVHAVRVSNDLWQRAQVVAQHRGETVSQVVRRSLSRYVWRYERVLGLTAADQDGGE